MLATLKIDSGGVVMLAIGRPKFWKSYELTLVCRVVERYAPPTFRLGESHSESNANLMAAEMSVLLSVKRLNVRLAERTVPSHAPFVVSAPVTNTRRAKSERSGSVRST